MRRPSIPAVARRLQSGNSARTPWGPTDGSTVGSEDNGIQDPRAARGAQRARRGGAGWGQVAPLLAVLLLNANESVSAERLALALWGEDAPASAVKTVQVHVSRLRKALGDADRSSRRRRPATACACARASSTPSASSGSSRTAAARWPTDTPSRPRPSCARRSRCGAGRPLAELEFEPFAQAEIARARGAAAGRASRRAWRPTSRPAGEAELDRRAAAARGCTTRPASGWPGQLDARALPLWPAGARRSRPTGRAPRARRRDRRRARAGAPSARRRRSCARTPRSRRRRCSSPTCRRELDAATAPPLVGTRRASSAWLRERLGAGARTGSRRRGHAPTASAGSARAVWQAELAGEVASARCRRAARSGPGPRPTVRARELIRAREATRPTLLVVDDAIARPRVRAGARRADACRRRRSRAGAGDRRRGRRRALAGRRRADGALDLLQPLGAQAVRAIAVRYAPDHATRTCPSTGCSTPAAAFPAASTRSPPSGPGARRRAAWTRSPSGPRPAAPQLRSMESELAGGVVELQAARRARRAGRRRRRCRCLPVQGARLVRVADAPYFFGRERLVAELVARLVGAPLLGVVGPSGSGKSSVLRAGLLPALAGGVLPGSEQLGAGRSSGPESSRCVSWAPRTTAGATAGCVLAVDQFEEIFTTCRDERGARGVHRRARPRGWRPARARTSW